MDIEVSLQRELGIRALRLMKSADFPGSWRARRWVEGFLRTIKPKGVVACSTDFGGEIVIDPRADSGVEHQIFYSGCYEEGTLHVISAVLAPGGRFADVGANVGLMSVVAALAVGSEGRVDSFEPLPEIRSLLEETVKRNGFSQVQVHAKAMGARDDVVELHRHLEVNRGSASLAWAGGDGARVQVAVQRLVDALPDWATRPIDMIKIDVEGWEFEVLKGAAEILGAKRAPILCVEFSRLHPLSGGTPEEMMSYLLGFGYQAFRLERGKGSRSPLVPLATGALPEHDNLFFVPTQRIGDLAKKRVISTADSA